MAPRLRAVPSPTPPTHLYPRERVTQALGRTLQRRIGLIQAPAGSGKSVAAQQYLSATSRRHVWIRIDPLRPTLGDLVLDLAAALGSPWQSTAASAVAQAAKQRTAPEQLARWLIGNGPPDVTIVLDDLHHLQNDDPTWSFLRLAMQSPHVHWLLISRSEMPVSVSTLVLNGDAFAPIGVETLAFTETEIRDMARAQSVSLDERTVRSIHALTSGWAAGIAFALIAARDNLDVTQISFSTRELAYQYFAEQYFASLKPVERRALYIIALTASATPSLLDRVGFKHSGALLDKLVRTISFLDRAQSQSIRIHDLFRDFVLSMLDRDDVERKRLPHAVAQALEQAGDLVGALELMLRVGDTTLVLDTLRTHTAVLVEQGRIDLLERALAAVPAAHRRSDAAIFAIRGVLANTAGDFEQAQHLYERALAEGAPDDIRWMCAARLSLLRVNRWLPDGEAPVAGYLNAANVNRRIEALSLTALGKVRGDLSGARSAMEHATTLLDSVDDEALRAKVLMRAAYVCFYLGDQERIEYYAQRAAERAERCGAMETATHCYSILYAHAYAHHKDYAVALHYAQRMQRAAERAGINHLRSTAIRAQFEIEAMRGREERVLALDRLLRDATDGYRDTLPYLHGKALSFGWNGDFAHAIRLLYPLSVAELPPVARNAVYALLAFYCAADERTDDARHYVERVDRTGAQHDPIADDYAALGAIFGGLAMVLLGRTKAARRFFLAHRALFTGNDAALFESLVEMAGQGGGEEFERAGKALSAAGFGGLGRTLTVIAHARKAPADAPLLSRTEIAILRAIANGESAKDVADRLDRSYHTIRTHIKTICRKLECSGMLEAIAAARRLRLL